MTQEIIRLKGMRGNALRLQVSIRTNKIQIRSFLRNIYGLNSSKIHSVVQGANPKMKEYIVYLK